MLWVLLMGSFKFWMMYDAFQRGQREYLWLIMLVPGGEFFYFLSVKMHDPGMRLAFRKYFPKREPGLAELRYHARETPSFANLLELSRGLFRAGEYLEAEEVLQGLLKRHERDREVLYGLACCKMKREQYAEAETLLKSVIDIEFSFRDYGAALELIKLYDQLGRPQEATDLLADIVRVGCRLEHRVQLARRLREAGDPASAREMLETALQDYRHAPKYVRRNSRRAAKDAQTLQREMAGA